MDDDLRSAFFWRALRVGHIRGRHELVRACFSYGGPPRRPVVHLIPPEHCCDVFHVYCDLKYCFHDLPHLVLREGGVAVRVRHGFRRGCV